MPSVRILERQISILDTVIVNDTTVYVSIT